jgi:hypothetical protein
MGEQHVSALTCDRFSLQQVHLMPETQSAAAPSAGKILKATIIALVVAALILVIAVLPAEYGIDPTGAGAALGLTALASASGALVAQDVPYQTDTIEFVLGSFQSVEYKYRLEMNHSMIYSWEATRPVIYDMHSEPDDAPEGYAESFDKQTQAEAHGEYTAPFTGIHGWYWENPGTGTVTIRVRTAGFYTEATEFGPGGATPHKLTELDTAARP